VKNLKVRKKNLKESKTIISRNNRDHSLGSHPFGHYPLALPLLSLAPSLQVNPFIC